MTDNLEQNVQHQCDNNRVLKSNILLHDVGLVFQNFGNASGRNLNECLIKPSGVDIHKVTSDCIVPVGLMDNKYTGDFKPSSDTPTHVAIYNEFPEIGGIVHIHSTYATSWAQSKRAIPCLGTTHADYWDGEIPITRDLTDDEISGEYEKDTGKVIIEKIKELNVHPLDCPGILVANHGPFVWGKDVEDAVKHAEILEFCAKLAWLSISINPNVRSITKTLMRKHHSRKHGPGAYYGQDLKL